jgi:hypothetical protein
MLSRPTVPPYFFTICVLELPWCEKMWPGLMSYPLAPTLATLLQMP